METETVHYSPTKTPGEVNDRYRVSVCGQKTAVGCDERLYAEGYEATSSNLKYVNCAACLARVEK